MASLKIFYLAALLTTSSCVRIPSEQGKSLLKPTPPLSVTLSEALDTPSFSEGDFPSSHWWKLFDDKFLTQLIETAIEYSPTIRRAEARVRASQSIAIQQRSHLFPTIGASGSVNWQYFGKNDFFRAFAASIPGHIDEYELSIDCVYSFDFWGKNRNLYQAAIGLEKAAEAERMGALLALTTAVAATYFQLQTHLQTEGLLKEEREILEQLMELAQKREEGALDDRIDTLSWEEKLLTVDRALLFVNQETKLARHLLATLLGEGPEAIWQADRVPFSSLPPFPLPSEISSNLLARRPDLMALIWRVESAAHQVGAAKADFYPRVDLCAFAGLDSVFFRKFFTPSSRIFSVNPAFHLPIFTAGRIRARLNQKQAEFQELIDTYNEEILKAVQEVADEISTLQAIDQMALLQNSLIDKGEKITMLNEMRYLHALSSLFDVLESRELVIRAKIVELDYAYKKRIATIKLIKALGGGYLTCKRPFDGN